MSRPISREDAETLLAMIGSAVVLGGDLGGWRRYFCEMGAEVAAVPGVPTHVVREMLVQGLDGMLDCRPDQRLDAFVGYGLRRFDEGVLAGEVRSARQNRAYYAALPGILGPEIMGLVRPNSA